LYFSGDGVYHQINLETLYDAVSQQYLRDKLEVQLISTARDYLRLGKKDLSKTFKEYQIYLMGYPNYSGAKPSEEKKNEERAFDMVATRIDKRQRFFDALTGAVASLPSTKKEVEGISRIAQKAGWQVVLKLADEASEENIKQIHGVRVLHVATHGFFIEAKDAKNEKEQKFDNPLLRSGLLLAGAELTLKGRSTGSKENGILTAKEAMDIDLGGTDLVVLSACETGLGEIKAGEGVFGLQRALQEAGAGSVVMSLWRVDDAATQELMNLFYENYLIKKQSKRVAFKQAQEALRAKYKEPYYWGAFVMVGE
jgi:CHAT domain-containing protein